MVIDGVVKIGKNCFVNPYVTIGLSARSDIGPSLYGPTIGDNVYVDTGAKVLGPITVGDNARLIADAIEEMIVVSEIGEQWSPNTPPPKTAAMIRPG